MPIGNFILTDTESARDGSDWPMVSYTFNDPDALVQILRRLPEGYQMSFGPSDQDIWQGICEIMASYSRAVEHNQRMRAWYAAIRFGQRGWSRSDMVHVVATLWMVMFDQSLPFVGNEREWTEQLYSAIAQTLHIELV